MSYNVVLLTIYRGLFCQDKKYNMAACDEMVSRDSRGFSWWYESLRSALLR